MSSHNTKPVTIDTFAKKKSAGEKITMLTAYDYPSAKIVEAAGVDSILVGDSLAMVVRGESSTLGVTLDELVYHLKMVRRATARALLIADMPFMSYQVDVKEAVRNAGRCLAEGGAAAVKLEGGVTMKETIRRVVEVGIPVCAHIGLTPQSVHQLGGFKVQKDEDRLMKDAEAVTEAGAFAVVLECIPEEIADKITRAFAIPTIGIGSGAKCDGQVLVFHDLLGLSYASEISPKFVKKYADLANVAVEACKAYIDEVKASKFPAEEHTYKLKK
ncbi:MAG: 3-methyl-2-oxobutanoate hydroxymethyltransferase [Planctomycetes bacterium]|nr:3-methyl-2-oxobutanoate hydroxymethyltransferase [Planctomycetota bacterium]